MSNANVQVTQQEVKKEVPKPYALYLQVMDKIEEARREIAPLLWELEKLGYPLQVSFYVDWSRGKHPYASALETLPIEE